MRVLVEGVVIPPGSTIGYVFGRTDDGTVGVVVVGDWRMVETIGMALRATDDLIVIEVEDRQVFGGWELPGENPEG